MQTLKTITQEKKKKQKKEKKGKEKKQTYGASILSDRQLSWILPPSDQPKLKVLSCYLACKFQD